MKTTQEVKLSMYRTVQMVCDEHAAIFNTNPAFVKAYSAYVTNIARIISTATSQSQVISGIAIDKFAAKKKLCHTATEIAGIVYAFATSVKNNSLRESVHFSYSDLLRIKDDLLTPTVNNIYDAVIKNQTELESFGISSTDADQLRSQIEEFSNAAPTTRKAISFKSTYNSKLEQLQKETDSILKDELDKLIISFKVSAPDFVSTYKNARVVVNGIKSTTQIKGVVVNKQTQLPMSNATVEITGSSTLKTQTSIEGKFTFKPVTPGAYKINVTPEGATQSINAQVEVKQGKTAKVTIAVSAS